MRFIPTRVHGVMDYLTGLLLIASPWMFNFARGGAETILPVALGAGALLYSPLTKYELGVARLIPMRTHLLLDVLSGMLLAASPWLFGFSDYVYAPHLILGLFEIAVSITTSTEPSYTPMKGKQYSEHAH
ncbi:MAG TPA: SPW repeat protein [Flavipsychrobacter sp.]|nr:SPW repeat protein [Flavipsychrobacter sp.]